MNGLPGAGNLVLGDDTGERAWREVEPAALHGPTAALVGSPSEAVGWVAAHVRTGSELLIAPSARVAAPLAAELGEAGLRVVRAGAPGPDPAPHSPEPDRLWLLTSGSTGRPKRVAHTLATLTTVAAPPAPQRWLCPYPPGSYAWWQLVTLSLAHPGQDLVLLDAGDPQVADTWPSRAAAQGVTAVSGTPTFWRRALLSDPEGLSRLDLRQVTLGGEPVDQAVLDRLAELFPRARVSWIYASSELGAAIVVHDGRAGFPRAWLGAGDHRVRLAVDGDELLVGSPHRGLGAGTDALVRTGDRVEVLGDRVHVVGRVGLDEVNVGGVKVSAGAVRAVLLDHPRVAWARVHGRRAPIVGSLVAAEVVLDPPAPASEEDAVVADLTRWCAGRLPEAAVPRRVRVLPAVPVKESLKSDVR